jgi:hypothetical protein
MQETQNPVQTLPDLSPTRHQVSSSILQKRLTKAMLTTVFYLRDYLIGRNCRFDPEDLSFLSSMHEAELACVATLTPPGDSGHRRLPLHQYPCNFTFDAFDACFSSTEKTGPPIQFFEPPTPNARHCRKARAHRDVSSATLRKRPKLFHFLNVPDVPATLSNQQSGKCKSIDILWISSEVFISTRSFSFHFGGGIHFLFGIKLTVRSRYRKGRTGPPLHLMFHYVPPSSKRQNIPLAKQRQEKRPSFQEIPFHFLCHLIKPLPYDFFSELELLSLARRPFSLTADVCSYFLSLAPDAFTEAAQEPIDSPSKLRNVIFRFNVEGLTSKHLQSIVSHEFRPYVQLRLDCLDRFYSPYVNAYPQGVEAVSASILNTLLSQCQCLRHLVVPPCCSSPQQSVENAGNSTFAENSSFKSLALELSQRDFNTAATKAILEGIRKNPKICTLEIRLANMASPVPSSGNNSELDRRSSMELSVHNFVDHLFSHVLFRHPSLKKVSIRIAQDNLAEAVIDDLQRLMDDVTDRIVPYMVGIGLHVLSFSAESTGQASRFTPNTSSWCNSIAPRLALNQYLSPARKLLSTAPRIACHAVSSVNLGALYRKNGFQPPPDTRAANATIVFDVIRHLGIYSKA